MLFGSISIVQHTLFSTSGSAENQYSDLNKVASVISRYVQPFTQSAYALPRYRFDQVMKFEHALGEDDSTKDDAPITEKSKVLHYGFLRELETMMRLRSPYTVNVYGIITTRKDSLVLVMELLTGGDLRSLLRNASEDLPEERVRLITKDVCAGIVFLHRKNIVHGDLKSPNVLFDGVGRAKVNVD